ncbi:MAG: hypothetical protein HZA46_19105 [Planctomycetales bacterium]|nr:hypothetical protein [Planctomycetales bacterium]
MRAVSPKRVPNRLGEPGAPHILLIGVRLGVAARPPPAASPKRNHFDPPENCSHTQPDMPWCIGFVDLMWRWHSVTPHVVTAPQGGHNKFRHGVSGPY